MAHSLAVRPESGRRTWTVVDEKYRTVAPVEEWLEAHRQLWSPNTVRGYATSLAQWWTFLEQRDETTKWRDLGVPAVSGFLSWLRNGRTAEHALVEPEEAPAPETLEARLAALISFYRWQEAVFSVPVAGRLMRGTPRRAPARGLLAHLDARTAPSPSSLVRVRRHRHRERPPLLLPTEIQAILDGCARPDRSSGEWAGNLRDRLLFALLAESGMRLGEALGLRISDFIMGRGGTPYVEIVPREDNQNGARVKMMRPRRVYVGTDLERLFVDYLTHLACRSSELGLEINTESPLLVNLDRPPLLAALRDGTVRDKTAALRRKNIGPTSWTPHWFRHSHATALLLAGTPEWVVSRRLGHAHVQTTLDLYGWVREDEALRAAANWKSYTSGWQVADSER
ncbi:transposase [Streptomyces sp. GBA 94-10 4N24]|uniref:tyrosine-type recombinase/integrase n=1 Tax=Streptomyces TaxID=1883 RepID=UPI0003C2F781|nr:MULTISPECIES: tyrosine-type recombinase/integrase [unclassified Streptomyces]QOZ97943.1 transposase [Streptomyces violascens]ESP95856.1 transposase [Streptomyces sp. GBA 94-10 4N24]ESQ01643.1 transposase [Streptomyces sp. GBA 94-10 4N24]ESQ01909.1 transposase [Streptomyces sp. PVA_94-07]ESQ07653.1 transposase [Streptomyces sp. PVA_94-07]